MVLPICSGRRRRMRQCAVTHRQCVEPGIAAAFGSDYRVYQRQLLRLRVEAALAAKCAGSGCSKLNRSNMLHQRKNSPVLGQNEERQMSTGQSINDYAQTIVAGSQRRSRVQHSDFTLEFDWAEAPLTALAPLTGERLRRRRRLSLVARQSPGFCRLTLMRKTAALDGYAQKFRRTALLLAPVGLS